MFITTNWIKFKGKLPAFECQTKVVHRVYCSTAPQEYTRACMQFFLALVYAKRGLCRPHRIVHLLYALRPGSEGNTGLSSLCMHCMAFKRQQESRGGLDTASVQMMLCPHFTLLKINKQLQRHTSSAILNDC